MVSLNDVAPFDEAPESGATFEDNALAKARDAFAATGLATVADDSGLEVAALGGRPGVHSARYAQDRTRPGGPGDADNWGKLLEEMREITWEQRQARFVCEIALALPDGRLFRTRGECPGRISLSPRGTQGFGYDPVFWVEEYGATMAQLGPEVKNRISHRARALTALREILATLKEELARFSVRVGT